MSLRDLTSVDRVTVRPRKGVTVELMFDPPVLLSDVRAISDAVKAAMTDGEPEDRVRAVLNPMTRAEQDDLRGLAARRQCPLNVLLATLAADGLRYQLDLERSTERAIARSAERDARRAGAQ